MSKYISLGFNVVLTIAVAVLYYLHFGSKTTTAPTAVPSSDSTAAPVVVIPESEIKKSGIVFVNTDTLLKNYDFYNASKKSLEARQKKAETSLTSAYTALQQEAMQFQKKAQEGQLTQEEGARKEQELMARQQELMQNKETQMGALMAEEQRLSEQLNKRLQDYVKRFSKDKSYTYILGYTGLSSNILFKNDSLDITRPILNGLNEEYRAKK